jgi:hypothetical protein
LRVCGAPEHSARTGRRREQEWISHPVAHGLDIILGQRTVLEAHACLGQAPCTTRTQSELQALAVATEPKKKKNVKLTPLVAADVPRVESISLDQGEHNHALPARAL